jgi:hypothetical protein
MKSFLYITKCLVYTGITYHVLGMVVCALVGAFEYMPSKSFSLALWIGIYLLHKRNGTI